MNCVGENHLLGSSRLDFVSCEHGEMTWRCLDCGETIIQYQDCNGG